MEQGGCSSVSGNLWRFVKRESVRSGGEPMKGRGLKRLQG